MKREMMITVAVVMGLMAGTGASLAAPEVGAAAPAFSLSAIDGTSHSLSDYRGKMVVLEWTNYDCPFVKKHYGSGNMQKLQKRYTAKDVIWLSICSSAPGKQGHYLPEAWEKMISDRKASPTALLLDADGTVGKAYGAKTTPHMFVIGADGALLYQGAIDDKRGINPKEVATALNYVAAALDAALAGKPVKESQIPSYGCSVKY
jgi:peroxiredoxin